MLYNIINTDINTILFNSKKEFNYLKEYNKFIMFLVNEQPRKWTLIEINVLLNNIEKVRNSFEILAKNIYKYLNL